MALLLDPRLVVVEVNEELVLILLMLLLLLLLMLLVLTREKVLLSEDMETYHSAASVLRSSSSHRWMQRSSRKAAHTCVLGCISMRIFLYALNIINFLPVWRDRDLTSFACLHSAWREESAINVGQHCDYRSAHLQARLHRITYSLTHAHTATPPLLKCKYLVL